MNPKETELSRLSFKIFHDMHIDNRPNHPIWILSDKRNMSNEIRFLFLMKYLRYIKDIIFVILKSGNQTNTTSYLNVINHSNTVYINDKK